MAPVLRRPTVNAVVRCAEVQCTSPPPRLETPVVGKSSGRAAEARIQLLNWIHVWGSDGVMGLACSVDMSR